MKQIEFPIKPNRSYYIDKSKISKTCTIVKIKYDRENDFDLPVFLKVNGSYRFTYNHHRLYFKDIQGVKFFQDKDGVTCLMIKVLSIRPDLSSCYDDDYENYINSTAGIYFSPISI